MAEPVILAEIPIGRSDVLRVTRQVDHGREVINLRRWFLATSGELRPGHDGIALGLDVFDAVVEAVGSLMSGKPAAAATRTPTEPQRPPAALKSREVCR